MLPLGWQVVLSMHKGQLALGVSYAVLDKYEQIRYGWERKYKSTRFWSSITCILHISREYSHHFQKFVFAHSHRNEEGIAYLSVHRSFLEAYQEQRTGEALANAYHDSI
jgi:hypothetical protein